METAGSHQARSAADRHGNSRKGEAVESMTFVPFGAANDICNRFLALLDRYKIQPPVGSSFEDELLSLTQLIEVTKNPNLVPEARRITVLRAAAGVHDFAAKVLSAEPLREFPKFIPHLRLISETKIAAATLSQNSEGAYNDDTARKMAELYMGCLAAHVGTDILLDSPTDAKGDNPDVIFTIEENDSIKQPQKWALAIKTISSKKGQTIFERIKEGGEQIDDPRCLADRGMVVINAKNALDHNALWDTTFSTLGDAIDALNKQLLSLAGNANANREQSEWDAVFSRKVARPVLFLGQSLVRLPTPASTQTPTAIKTLVPYDANGPLDPVAHGLATCLNHFMQTILLGIPGGHGYLPR
jgi:hypothetical protein